MITNLKDVGSDNQLLSCIIHAVSFTVEVIVNAMLM